MRSLFSAGLLGLLTRSCFCGGEIFSSKFFSDENLFSLRNMIASAGPATWQENSCVLFGELVDGAREAFFRFIWVDHLIFLGPVDLRWIKEEVCPTCRKA